MSSELEGGEPDHCPSRTLLNLGKTTAVAMSHPKARSEKWCNSQKGFGFIQLETEACFRSHSSRRARGDVPVERRSDVPRCMNCISNKRSLEQAQSTFPASSSRKILSFDLSQGPLVYAFGFPRAHAAKQALSGRSIGADAFFQLPS